MNVNDVIRQLNNNNKIEPLPEDHYGDVLSTPKLVENGRLKTCDKVLANFPFSMNWDNKIAEDTLSSIQ